VNVGKEYSVELEVIDG